MAEGGSGRGNAELCQSLLDLYDAADIVFNTILARVKSEEAKLNNLSARITEREVMVTKLYEASKAGVKIDCIVRGMCLVRTGIPNVSDNIRVVSILGRFLERHRVFRFENGCRKKEITGLKKRKELLKIDKFPILQQVLEKEERSFPVKRC